MCYTKPIATINRRLTDALTAATLAVLALPGLAAERAPQAPRVPFAYPAGGPVTAGNLNQFFDAAKTRAASVNGPAASRGVPAPAPRALPAAPELPKAARLHQQMVVPVPHLPQASPAYKRTFRILLNNADQTDRYDDLIVRYARKYRLDARLMKSVMAAESEFKPEALSPSGARGLMQVMPKTAEYVGVPAGKLHDPKWGVMAGAAYLQILFMTAWKLFKLKGVRYTDAPHWVIQRVIAAYHAGPKYLITTRWVPATRAYVRKVMLYYHSKVTDLRRPAPALSPLPSLRDTLVSSGTLH